MALVPPGDRARAAGAGVGQQHSPGVLVHAHRPRRLLADGSVVVDETATRTPLDAPGPPPQRCGVGIVLGRKDAAGVHAEVLIVTLAANGPARACGKIQPGDVSLPVCSWPRVSVSRAAQQHPVCVPVRVPCNGRKDVGPRTPSPLPACPMPSRPRSHCFSLACGCAGVGGGERRAVHRPTACGYHRCVMMPDLCLARPPTRSHARADPRRTAVAHTRRRDRGRTRHDSHLTCQDDWPGAWPRFGRKHVILPSRRHLHASHPCLTWVHARS